MWRRIGIEPGEGRIFAWGAVTLFLVGWAEVSVKNVSETFFLKRVDVELLPAVFLASSLALVGTTYVIGRLAAHRNRLHLLPLVLAVLGLTLLPLWLMVRAEVTSALALLVIAAKQIQSAALIVFLIAMGDLLHGRQAKRLFAPLLAGMTLGAILGSFASYPLSRVIGIGGLLPFSAGVLLVSALTTLPLRNLVPLRLKRRFGQRNLIGPDDSEDAKPTLRGMWAESGLFRLMLLSTLFAGLLGPMLYFQFQYVADLSTREGGEDQLLALYSQFRGWLSIAILLTQLDTASRLYRRIGIPLSAALSPLVYLLGFFGLSVRLSLGAGVGAMTATKVQDNAVYDPAQRILFNLFPERIRSWATALLEGPLKRGGGALGNVVIIAALAVGTAPLVGYIALPISLAWFGVGLMLWRSYPALLLQASAVRGELGRDLDLGELLDRGTVRGLATHLLEDDPRACSAAIDLVGEARVELAAEALAAAACDAPVANRPLLVTALDRRVQRDGGCPDRAIVSGRTRRELEAFLADPVGLDDGDRAALVRAYAWLCGEDDEARNILEPGLRDESPGVRLATVAALHGNAPNEELDGALAAAVQGDDAVARRIARDELRCLLLATEPENDGWKPRFDLLVSLLANASERNAAAACLADVAEQHGDAAAGALAAMLALKDGEADARIALLRYLGGIGAAADATRS